jgi:flagellar biosynthesis anti-sigma factor FlgM
MPILYSKEHSIPYQPEQPMNIENITMSPITQMDTQPKKTTTHAAPETAQPAKATGEAFSVEISSEAEKLNKPQNSDEISRDKVAAIRDQLAAGTYNISGKDVANKILGVLKG